MLNKVHLIDNMVFMANIPDKYYDLAIVDPPYREQNNPTKWMNKISDMKKFGNKPNKKYFSELFRVSKYQIIWGSNNFGLVFMGFVVWDKGVRGVKRYSWAEIASLSSNLSTVTTIVKIKSEEDKIHPTQKPVALYKWLLQNYAKPGQNIFDSHVGSGSIRIACHDLGFDFEGCELDPDYWQAQEERYNKHVEKNSKMFFKDTVIIDRKKEFFK